MKTRAPLFLEQTPNGVLARRTKELLQRLEPILGYKIRVVERTGASLKNTLEQTNIWNGLKCGRAPCITCNQGGEDLPACTRSSVVYENICTRCNPDAKTKGELREQARGAPSLYMGETSRSIQERAVEHWGAARRNEETSHMAKHQIMEHGGAPPEFMFKVISYHRTPLNRQIKEAIRIRRRGGATEILNSRSEFNRCHIPRLVVEKEDDEIRKAREKREQEEIKELISNLDNEELSWKEEI